MGGGLSATSLYVKVKKMKIIQKYLWIIVLSFHSITFAQSFSYFPLAVGNKWFFSQGLDNVARLKLEIQKDTTLGDGYSYAKLNMYKVNPDSSFSLLNDGYSYLRKENRKIIEYPDRLIFDYDMNIGDTVISFYNEPESAVLDTIISEDIFGRNSKTYVFFFTQYDFYTYSDSIGFNTLWATTWNNWVPEYLLGCEIDGRIYGSVITSVKNKNELPTHFILYQNYPNPFNPSTRIKYSISKGSFVTLKVYDILGKEITTLVNEEKPYGNYEVIYDGSNLTSGVYFYKMQAGSFIDTKKFILIK